MCPRLIVSQAPQGGGLPHYTSGHADIAAASLHYGSLESPNGKLEF